MQTDPTKLLDELLEFDEWLNEPPSREVLEHTVARSYRFDAYRKWEKIAVPLAAILRSLAEVQPIPEQPDTQRLAMEACRLLCAVAVVQENPDKVVCPPSFVPAVRAAMLALRAHLPIAAMKEPTA